MQRKKITVVGAGNVGATTAQLAAIQNLGDIILIDIVKGLAEGKALDLLQAASLCNYNVNIVGTTDWSQTVDSDVVIITSGLPRKPGMSRDDLLAKNTEIVKNVTEQIVKYSPKSFIIVVCNPLDAMVYAAAKVSSFEKNRVMGMAGTLDCARFSCFISHELGVSVDQIQAILMGGHGDDMVPLPRYTSINGIPLTELLCNDTIEKIIARTRNGGIEIVNLLGYSAYYAPAAGAVKMAKAILRNDRALICCCAYCLKEYNIGGFFVGVPVIIGTNGVERIVELELNQSENKELQVSVEHVRQLVAKVDALL